MLSEFLEDEDWKTVAAGVQMYHLQRGGLQEGLYEFTPGEQCDGRFEFFFCRGGSFLLGRKKSPPMRIGDQEIFVFSDGSDVKSIQVTGPLTGYCVSVDRDVVRPVFRTICRIFGNMEIDDGRIWNMMKGHNGCIRVHSTMWSRASFSVLGNLPAAEQGRYCMLKIMELMYLLCMQHTLTEGSDSDISQSLGYSAHTIGRIRAYMENHLDEKLTILVLSRKFHLSSTALKSGFRSLYGQPIHTWLQDKRIQRAAELLSFSDLTILQIAQSVGYEGVSQFNVIFKKKYGVTPSQYRKMSDPVRI